MTMFGMLKGIQERAWRSSVENPVLRDPTKIRAELAQIDQDFQRLLDRLSAMAMSEDPARVARIASVKSTQLILEFATASTWFLRRIITHPEISEKHSHVLSYLRDQAATYPTFPILFHEKMDLSPYENLQIGYRSRHSNDPRVRSGNSAFSPYACQLIRRLEWVRIEQKAIREGKWERLIASGPYQFYQGMSIPDRSYGWCKNMSEEEFHMLTRIHAEQPDDLEDLVNLDPFSKVTAKQWARIAKTFFKQVFPNPLKLKSLAKAARNPNLQYESQIRAQIVQRIGRAVVAYAR